MPEIIIKPVNQADIPLLKKHLGFGERARYSETSHQHSLERQKAGEITYLIAWNDKIPVGHLAINWHGADDPGLKKSVDLSDCPNIYRVLVHPNSRQQGIASRLMDHAEKIIRNKGFKKAGLGVALDNHRAARIYKKRGYQPTGYKYLFNDMEYLDINGQRQKHPEQCEYLIKQL